MESQCGGFRSLRACWLPRLGGPTWSPYRRAVAVNQVRTPEGGSGERSVDSSACLRRLPPFLRFPPSPPSRVTPQGYFLTGNPGLKAWVWRAQWTLPFTILWLRAAWRTATSRRLEKDGDAGRRLRQWFRGILSLDLLRALPGKQRPAPPGAPQGRGAERTGGIAARPPRRRLGPSEPSGSESYKLSAIARVRRCGRQGDIVGAVVPNLQPRSPPAWLRARCEVAVGAALARSGTRRAWGWDPVLQPRRTADLVVGPRRDEAVEGFLLLCPGTLSPFVPPPPALGHAPWTTARSLPLATWRGRPKSCSERWTRGSCRAGGSGPPPQTPGRRGQTPGWKKRERQERARLPRLADTARRGSWWHWRGRRAGGGSEPGPARAPRPPCHIPPDSAARGMAPLPALCLFRPCFPDPPSLPSVLQAPETKVSVWESGLVEEFSNSLTPEPSAPVPENREVPGCLALASGGLSGWLSLPAAGLAPGASSGCSVPGGGWLAGPWSPFTGSGLTRRAATRARLRVRGRAPACSLPWSCKRKGKD